MDGIEDSFSLRQITISRDVSNYHIQAEIK